MCFSTIPPQGRRRRRFFWHPMLDNPARKFEITKIAMPPKSDFDGAWKEAFQAKLRPILELCFPDVASQIGWQIPFEFLDQALQRVVRDAKLGRLRVDKLVKVARKDGARQLVLIHLELQTQPDKDLPRRVYHYHHRISDCFGLPVVTLVILADDRPHWKPTVYEEKLWGCHLRFEYPVSKLLELARDPLFLEQSPNPAAVVVAAHLAALATAKDSERRLKLKWQLTRRLYERGYDKQEVLEMFRLIDWLLWLPPDLELEFRHEVVEYEKEKAMPYITSIERIGRKEGRQEGRQEDILQVLEVRFGEVPYQLREKLLALRDDAQLRRLLRQAIVAKTLSAFNSKLK